MVLSRQARHGLSILTCVLVVLFTGSPASTKERAIRAAAINSSANTGSAETSISAPARFFTIKQVLARIDAGEPLAKQDRPNHGLRLTSLRDPVAADEIAGARAPLQTDEPFGLFTFRAPDGSLWRKWRRLELEQIVESRLITSCKEHAELCTPAARQFANIIESVKARSGRDRLQHANRTINAAIRYVSDLMQHGELDRWTAPLATLAAGRGDCEDYAIAKYAVLRSAGVPAEDLKLLLVRDRSIREDHAVLAARDGHRWLILDNRHQILAEPTNLQHFTPLYALDHEGVKLFAAPYVAPEPEHADVKLATATSLDSDTVNQSVFSSGSIQNDTASVGFADLPLVM